MFTLRYYFSLVYAYMVRFKLIVFLGVILGLVSFIGLQVFLPSFVVNQERIGVSGRYRADSLPEFISGQISEGLTKISETGVVSSGIADNWQVSDDGKEWLFHVDQSKKWQDGSKIFSKELNYQFEDVEVVYPDNDTVLFKLSEPFAPFPTVLTKPVFKKGLLGTGEWKVSKLSLSSGVVQDLTLKNKEKGKKVYKFFPTQENAKLAFKLGEVDSLVDLVDPTPFDTWRTVEIRKEIAKDRVLTLFFNNKDPMFDNSKPFRQALSYAIDKNAFDGSRAISSIKPNTWAYNSQVKPYDYDLARAKELITDLPVELKENNEIKLVANPLLLDSAEKIANFWRELGLKVGVQVTSSFPDEYSAFLAIYEIPSDPDQYFLWHSTQTATNVSKYSNQRIDKLLEDGRTTTDQDERKKIYLDFQRFLLEDAPAAFLVHPISYTVVRK